MLAAVFAMGVHSTFFGPIKYAILPQHLHKDEVLGGTGLVEAGTYIAILAARSSPGTSRSNAPQRLLVVDPFACSAISRPPGPARAARGRRCRSTGTSSAPRSRWSARPCISARLFLAILRDQLLLDHRRGAVHQFPPLAKNVLGAEQGSRQPVPRIFSVGVAIGSVAINALLKAMSRRASRPPRCSRWAGSCCSCASSRRMGQHRAPT